MAANEIHVGDAGTVFTINVLDGTTAVDLSSANTSTSRLIYFIDSSGNTSTANALFSGSGTAGVLLFTTTASTFNTSGSWKMQLALILGTTTAAFRTDVYRFTVYPNL